METSKYSSIRNLDQLDKALDELRTEQQLTKAKIASDYKFFKTFYTPANFFNFLLDKISPAFNLIGLGIDLYDRISEKIAAHRAARKARHQQVPDEHESDQQSEPAMPEETTPETPAAEA